MIEHNDYCSHVKYHRNIIYSSSLFSQNQSRINSRHAVYTSIAALNSAESVWMERIERKRTRFWSAAMRVHMYIVYIRADAEALGSFIRPRQPGPIISSLALSKSATLYCVCVCIRARNVRAANGPIRPESKPLGAHVVPDPIFEFQMMI